MIKVPQTGTIIQVNPLEAGFTHPVDEELNKRACEPTVIKKSS